MPSLCRRAGCGRGGTHGELGSRADADRIAGEPMHAASPPPPPPLFPLLACSASGSVSGKEPRAMRVCATGMPVCCTNSLTSAAARGAQLSCLGCGCGSWGSRRAEVGHKGRDGATADRRQRCRGSAQGAAWAYGPHAQKAALQANQKQRPRRGAGRTTHQSRRSRRQCTAPAAWHCGWPPQPPAA
mgnify:CR=1 FL=1